MARPHKHADGLLEQVVGVVRSAAALCSHEELKRQRTFKSDKTFATGVDIAIEQYLKEHLARLEPDAGCMAEESGETDTAKSCQWVIDPIDGTINFAHNFPYFAISVALVCKGEPELGVIYQPSTAEMFYGRRGGGAFLNGVPLAVSSERQLEHLFISITVPAHKADYVALCKLTGQLEQISYSVRKMGAAALDLAYVAAGRIDAAVIKYVKWWDIAAGIVLIREAGGAITEFGKHSIDMHFESCLATNGVVHADIQALLV